MHHQFPVEGLEEFAERLGVTGPAPGDQLCCHGIVLVSSRPTAWCGAAVGDGLVRSSGLSRGLPRRGSRPAPRVG